MAVKKLQEKNVFKHKLTSRSIFLTATKPISVQVGGFLEPSLYLKQGNFDKSFYSKYLAPDINETNES